jgi:flagellin-like hook-associated protein FlgL
VSINAAGRGLQVSDTNGVPLNLEISASSVLDDTAAQLGIVGTVSPTLVGTDLNPQVDFALAETTGTTATDLGINGSILSNYVGRDLDARLTVNSQLADLMNGLGLGGDSIVLHQGNGMTTINLGTAALATVQDLLDAINTSGLDVTASINASGRGIQIVNNDTTMSFTIEEVNNGRAAKALGLFGSSDIMGSMMVLANALRNDDQEGTGLLLQNLDDGIQNLLNYRATVGARAIRLDTTDNRLLDVELSFTRMLTSVEDADMTKLVTDLSTHENAYQAALMATAKIIQPSLLDFLQ